MSIAVFMNKFDIFPILSPETKAIFVGRDVKYLLEYYSANKIIFRVGNAL